MKLTKILSGCGLLFLFIVSCQKADKQEEAPAHYNRIVTLDGAVSEVVAALGKEEAIVATDVTSNYPPSLAEKPKIGHNRSMSPEGILAQEPDVVLGIDSEKDQQLTEQLRSSGVEVILFPLEYSAGGVINLINAVNDSLGIEKPTDSLEKSIREPLDQVKQFENAPKVLFIYARGAGTLLAAGTGTALDKMITLAGAQNAAATFEGFKPLTAEALVAAEPDIMLMFDSGLSSLEGKSGLLNVPGVMQTPAGKNEAIITMDGQYLSGFGPRMGKAALDLNNKIHKQQAQ